MYVWEAHKELALSIGDPINANQSVIPDGVRYTKLLRDSYLYRSMLSIYNSVLKEVASLPKKFVSFVLNNLFPMTVLEESYEPSSFTSRYLQDHGEHWLVLQDIQLCYILSARIYVGTRGIFPLPIKDPIEANGLLNTRNIQKPDSFFVFFGDVTNTRLYIYDFDGFMPEASEIHIKALRYPIHPRNQFPSDILTIEPHYIPKVLALSTIYAQADSQEVDSAQYIPLILGGNDAIFKNVGGN